MDDEDEERGRTVRMSRRELGIWRRLSHPNIVEFLGTISGFKQKECVSIVSAWMPNGTLQEFLLKSKDQLTATRRLELVLDIASGLDYLHSLHIVHGDLSSANVLVNSELKACLADFGYSSLLGEMPQGVSYPQATMPRAGAARWTAPELLLKETTPMTTKSDIYSFGNLALLVLSGNQPWPRYKLDPAIIRGMNKGLKPGNRETHPMDDRYWGLVEPCWLEVADRPPTKGIVSSIQQFLRIPGVPAQQVPIQPMRWGPYHYTVDAYGQPASPRYYRPMQPHPPYTPHPPPPVAQGPPQPHAPHTHQPSCSIIVSSPHPTLSTATPPVARPLNPSAPPFVPKTRARKAIVIKNKDGTEVSLESLKKRSLKPPTVPIPPLSPVATSRRGVPVRIESEKSKRKQEAQARLEQARLEQARLEQEAEAEAEEQVKKETEELKRKEEEGGGYSLRRNGM